MDLPIDTILEGDCIDVLGTLPERCVDLVFADPPYNLQLSQRLLRPDQTEVDAVDDDWDRFSGFAEYDAFTRAWLGACRRVLKDTGTLWVIGTYHNIHRVGTALQDLGYWILNDVAWVKTNPMPQFRGVRFCNAHESLIWAQKSREQARYTFNYRGLKAGNDDLQMRSDWYLPICTGSERLRSASGKVHSTQKPEALLHRIVRACTLPGDLVLDPFLGSGTTGAVARALGRRYLGIEREPAYVEAARARIAATEPALPETLVDPGFAPPRRVAFALLVELGVIEAGVRLRLDGREEFATVQADGTLVSGDLHGSIHGLGARLLSAPACNGWEHWRYRDDATGQWVVIDALRERARSLLEGR